MSPLRGELEDKARRQLAQLPPGVAHHHVIAVSHEMPPEKADVAISAPYWNRELAHSDARKFRELIIGIVRGYEVAVLACDRACPTSSIGDFGKPSSDA